MQPPTRARTALSVAILAALYLWVFPYHAAVNNPNENVRVYMSVALVDDSTFAINRVEQLWGYVNDKAVRNGRLYSSKAPGTSYLGAPVYWALTKITGRSTRPPPPQRLGAPRVTPPRPIEKTQVLYVLRLFCNVLPALVFAWFWHRFLGARTRSAAVREGVFFSTMAGSALMAYSLVFASHAQNAICFGAALMALATARARDHARSAAGSPQRVDAWPMFLAGLFGAGATLFEYPAALASAAVALWIVALAAERRRWLLPAAGVALGLAAAHAAKKHKLPPAPPGAHAVGLYAATLSLRGVGRLVMAGLGGAIPTGLTLWYHHRCFGDPFKPGYDFLENPTFREETNQGFYGATSFSWEAALRLWFDPAFGLIPCSLVLTLAVVGAGSALSLDLEARGLRAVRNAITALLAAAVAVAAVKVALIVKAHPEPVPFNDIGPWVAALVVAAVGLAAAWMPRPRSPERAMAFTMILACVGLTRLIGAMNNWRGGWQVGPRYLATLIPAVGVFALWGADAMMERASPAGRRAVTLFVAGSTLTAVLVTGLPAAWFPHIPLEYGSPFFEMIVPLLRDGFFPHSVGEYVGLHGALAMAGFALGALALALVVLRGDERRPAPALAHALGGLAVCLALLLPFAKAARPSTAPVTRYVKTAFEPRPSPSTPAATSAARETPAQARDRAETLAQAGDAAGALAAWRRSLTPGH
ncbi:MAG: hypothetical protein R3A52_13545 [Polyangiales bacterium]